MRPGDEVLVKVEQRHDKLETPFHPEPHQVITRNGSQVTIQSPAGVRYKCNVTAVKCYIRAPEEPVAAGPQAELREPPSVELLTLPEQVEVLVPPTPVPPELAPAMAPVAVPSSAAVASSRPSQAAGMPKHFKDYVMG